MTRRLTRFVQIEAWIEFLGTIGTQAMTEIGFGVGMEVGLQLIPEAIVIPDLFARGAHGKQATQSFYVVLRLLKFEERLKLTPPRASSSAAASFGSALTSRISVFLEVRRTVRISSRAARP